MFATSISTEKLDAALSKAQGEMKPAHLNRVNPFYKSKYADLASLRESYQVALTKHGISISQWLIHSDDHRVHIVTRMALAGEWIQSEFSIPVTKADAQGYGAVTTYAKRIALAAALGVVADDDDDGNTTIQNPQSSPQSSQDSNQSPARPDISPVQTPAWRPSEAQLKRLFAISKAANWKESTVRDYMAEHFGLESTSHLNKAQYDQICNRMQAKTEDDVP